MKSQAQIPACLCGAAPAVPGLDVSQPVASPRQPWPRLLPLLAALSSVVLPLVGCVDPTQPGESVAPVAQVAQGVVAPFQRNVALNNPSSQSSTHSSAFPAANANDGMIHQTYWPATTPRISHTAAENQPWWQVDVLDVLWINEVVLYGRWDCCQDRLKPFEVRVSTDGSNWTQIYYSTVNPPIPLRIEANLPARYVQVRLLGYGTLELDEVQVLQNEKGTNIARLGTASQSSTGYGGDAARAIDGNPDGVYGNASVTHTGFETAPWWQVDLQKSRFIGEVKIHNRTDCCAERLSDFDVKVSNDLVTWYVLPFSGTPSFPLTVPINTLGRYVRIQLRGSNALSLAEVEVHTVPSNLARGRATAQSSTLVGGESYRAVDDNTDGVFSNGSVTHTKQIDYTDPAWWEVSLDGIRAISGVVVYNRSDCCIDRARNYKIYAANEDMSIPGNSRLSWQIGQNTFRASDLGSYTLWNGFAQTLRIQIPAGVDLHMAEVKVLGANKACGQNQVALDGTTCVTLRKWEYGDPTPLDGRRVAIKVRSIRVGTTPQTWNRWLGLDGGRLNAVDGDLRSRDLFTLTSYQPASSHGLPWYTLRAQSGGYVYHGGASLGGVLYDAASSDDGWMLTRGTNPALAGSVQYVATTKAGLDSRWKNRFDWYAALTTASPGYSFLTGCFDPYWVASEQRAYFSSTSCSSDTNDFEYYFVD